MSEDQTVGVRVGSNALLGELTYEVRVAGPDDVIPMQDEISALRHANAINKTYLADRLKHPHDEVMCVATVHAVPSATRAKGFEMDLPTVEHALMFSRNYASASPYLSKTAREHITGLCDLLEATQTRMASLRRDAERYRFMRSRSITPSAAVACASAVDELYGDEMDAAIDAAMQPNNQANRRICRPEEPHE